MSINWTYSEDGEEEHWWNENSLKSLKKRPLLETSMMMKRDHPVFIGVPIGTIVLTERGKEVRSERGRQVFALFETAPPKEEKKKTTGTRRRRRERNEKKDDDDKDKRCRFALESTSSSSLAKTVTITMGSMFGPKWNGKKLSAKIVSELRNWERNGVIAGAYVVQVLNRYEYFIVTVDMMESSDGSVDIVGVDKNKRFQGTRKLGEKVASRMEEYIIGLDGKSMANVMFTGRVIQLLPPAAYVLQLDPPDYDPSCEYNWWSGFAIREEHELLTKEEEMEERERTGYWTPEEENK